MSRRASAAEYRAERGRTLIERKQHGREVEELLEHPRIQAAFARIDAGIADIFNRRDLNERQAFEVYLTSGLWDRLKVTFQTVVREGNDAEIELLKLDNDAQKAQQSR